MEKPPEGPVIDWMREVLTNIWAALKALVVLIGSIPERIDERLGSLEWKAVIVVALLGLFMLGSGWLARGRK